MIKTFGCVPLLCTIFTYANLIYILRVSCVLLLINLRIMLGSQLWLQKCLVCVCWYYNYFSNTSYHYSEYYLNNKFTLLYTAPPVHSGCNRTRRGTFSEFPILPQSNNRYQRLCHTPRLVKGSSRLDSGDAMKERIFKKCIESSNVRECQI